MKEETAVVQIFIHEQFGKIRTVILLTGNFGFVTADVCRALEIQNVTQAVSRLKDNEQAMFNIGRSKIHGGGGETNCVNEPGLYRLIFASRKPEAEKFQNWVYHEILPSIRKTGTYNINRDSSGNPYFPPELSERWLDEKTSEALIQIAKLLKAGRNKEKLFGKATVILIGEDILAKSEEEFVRKF